MSSAEVLAVTDRAVILERGTIVHAADSAALKADPKLITAARVFDVYRGAGLGEGKKSLAIEVTLQPRDKTLTDADIDAVSQKIVAAVAKSTGGVAVKNRPSVIAGSTRCAPTSSTRRRPV